MTLPRFHAQGIEVANSVGVRVHVIQAKEDVATNFWRVIVALVGTSLMIALLPQENRPLQDDPDATHVPPVIAAP
jgi:hypothetical protein